jgi:hypothetical protein
MQVGQWVEWTPPMFHGVVEMNPMRGWIVAAEGDWVVVRVSSMKHPQAPFATFNKHQLKTIEEIELVQRGAVLLS